MVLTVNDDTEAVARHPLDVDAVERRDDVVRALRVDLLDRMRSADRDRLGTRSDTSLDAGRRVFKDDALLDGDPELLGGEDKGSRVGLAGRKARVVGGDRDLGTLDAGASKGAVAVYARVASSPSQFLR